MEPLISPRGLIVDLITPFKSDGSIDGLGLEKLFDRLIPNAQAILLASPQTGEGKNLDASKRSVLLEKALILVHGQIPILIWVSQDTEEKTKETILILKKTIENQKYTGQVFWVDSPLYYHSNRGLPEYYQNLCPIAGQPIILHNDPELIKGLARSFKRRNVRTCILKELTSFDNIIGLIFSGPLDRAHNYQRACRRRPNFRIYDGDETHFLDYPSTSGVVSVGANLAPSAWQRITQSSLRITADQKDYPDHLQQVFDLGKYLHELKNIYYKMPVAIIKELLSDMGIIKTSACTSPSKDVEELKNKAKELMARHNNNSIEYAK
jgi:dihydrodipicolinate synthase/N-acetylneuraminate lyase